MQLPSLSIAQEVEFVAVSAAVLYFLKLFFNSRKDLKLVSYIITYALFILIRVYKRVSKSKEFQRSLDKIHSELIVLKNKHKTDKMIVG